MSDILTAPADTSLYPGREIPVPLAEDTDLWPQPGCIAAADDDGLCVSAAADEAVMALGRVERIEPAVAERDATAIIHRGPVTLANDATHPVTQAHLFLTATLGADDATAAAPDEAGFQLGKILRVDDTGVVVEIL